ncbi:Threonine/homoserine/homoserine lactone efflux protein [Reichenbachiella faecimaris]|uniref:Threonine/homoserine/homoserine lactone efflux protein n=1 Tax=Reichenbachiella faecimaris TaxID=692418 RepID=A0A1W2GHV7_REIFA|nr:LysE family transporter [Reichenbachiella faecimaris]SMD36243.1 Threonine/homoserine/homoserine lactone efflux protein [Reichenbachiella faecimaris]
MSILILFGVAFLFSFIGSIPPGSINITILQYALEKRIKAAYAFATAAALTEYLYAAIAVRFQIYLTANANVSQYFQVISGSVLILLGVLNLLKKPDQSNPTAIGEKRNAFKKGILLSLTNPLAIPFWLMVTAYLQSMGLVSLTHQNFWIYVAGVSVGTFCLLISVIHLGSRFTATQGNTFLIYRVPGLIFIGIGIWSFVT